MPDVEKTPRKTIRIDNDLWEKYAAWCESRGTTRSIDLRAYVARRAREWDREQARHGEEGSDASSSG